jgi:hypothetical protein
LDFGRRCKICRYFERIRPDPGAIAARIDVEEISAVGAHDAVAPTHRVWESAEKLARSAAVGRSPLPELHPLIKGERIRSATGQAFLVVK